MNIFKASIFAATPIASLSFTTLDGLAKTLQSLFRMAGAHDLLEDISLLAVPAANLVFIT